MFKTRCCQLAHPGRVLDTREKEGVLVSPGSVAGHSAFQKSGRSPQWVGEGAS